MKSRLIKADSDVMNQVVLAQDRVWEIICGLRRALDEAEEKDKESTFQSHIYLKVMNTSKCIYRVLIFTTKIKYLKNPNLNLPRTVTTQTTLCTH